MSKNIKIYPAQVKKTVLVTGARLSSILEYSKLNILEERVTIRI